MDFDETLKACPLLKIGDAQILSDGQGFFIFDTEKEMEEAYDRIVGDDGPTQSNPYNGPARIHAATCNDKGRFLNENT